MDRLAPWFAGLVLAIPVLVARYPPMADLPLHEACVGLMRHWGDPVFAPKTLYFLNLGHSNQLFSFLLFGLSFVLPIGVASKTLVALILLALPLAAARFADHLGASRWTAALVAAPLGFGWMFFFGLIQNILGITILLALLPAIDRFAAEPTVRRMAGMCAAVVLLHFAHQAMQIVACAAIVLCSVGTQARARSIALRAAPVLLALVIVYLAGKYAWQYAGPRHLRQPPFVFFGPGYKLLVVSGVLFGGYEPWVRNSMLALALLPVVLFAADRRRPGAVRETWAERVHAWRFEVLAGLLFLVYLTAPGNIRSTTLVYQRFLPPAWALFVVACASRPGRRAGSTPAPRLAPLLCAALPVASVLIGWPALADSDRVYSDLAALADYVEPGSAMMALNFGNNPAHRLWNPVDAMATLVAERGGRALFDYTQSPVSPVAQRPEKEWANAVDRMEHDPFQLRPDWDFTRFRYLFLITNDKAFAAAATLAMRDQARFVDAKGDWFLYESRLPRVPIDADDALLPSPRPPTLRAMLRSTVKEMQAIESGTAPIPDIPVEPEPAFTDRGEFR